ncbi:MAG: hypothetical protein Q9227_001614 [Pyrenula ochraceoflavens]
MAISTPSQSGSEIGLLSRTVLPSPAAKWILPAKLRDFEYKRNQPGDGAYNDVAFVGDHWVSLCEYRDDCLIDLNVKASFKPCIMGAKVIKNPMATSSYGTNSDLRSPPDILVVVLDSKDLVFLTTCGEPGEKVSFSYLRRPLPGHRSEMERYGKHMAVDPHSRLLAVASFQRFVAIYALKKRDDTTQSRKDGAAQLDSKTELIREERFFKVDGTILKIDFLCPTENQNSLIHLLLVISKSQRTYFQVHTWDSMKKLHTFPDSPQHTRIVSAEEKVPLLLIPSSRTTSFILVFQDTLRLYNAMKNGSQNPKIYRIETGNENVQSTQSQRRLWVQWQKALRRSDYLEDKDDFYLCREDGLMQYFEVTVKPEPDIQLHFKIRLQPCRVDSAFAIMSSIGSEGVPESHDVVLVGGDLTDGGVFHINARKDPEREQNIPNWAPVRDLLCLPEKILSDGHVDSALPTSERLFVCCGRSSESSTEGVEDTGKISELQYAFEAEMVLRAEMRCPTKTEFDSTAIDPMLATNLWIVQDRPNSRMAYLASFPEETIVGIIPQPSRKIHHTDGTYEDVEEIEDNNGTGNIEVNLLLDAPTLAAGSNADTHAIQITPKAVNIWEFSVARTGSAVDLGLESSIITAAVDQNAEVVLLAMKDAFQLKLEIHEVFRDQSILQLRLIAEPKILSDDPTSVLIVRLGPYPISLVGYSTGVLDIYGLNDRGSLSLLSSQDLRHPINGFGPSAVDSIAVPESDHNNAPATFIRTRHRLGLTSVKLVADTKRPGSAFAICESSTFWINCNRNGTFTDPQVFHILFHDPSENLKYERLSLRTESDARQVAPEQQRIQVICRMGDFHEEIIYEERSQRKKYSKVKKIVRENIVACVVNGDFIICRISLAPQGIPAQSFIGSNPTCLVHSPSLQKFIVGSENVSIDNGKRAIRPLLLTFSSDHSPEGFLSVPDAKTHFGKAGEKISQMMVWRPLVGQNPYELLIVATNNEEEGRIIFFKTHKVKKSRSEFKFTAGWRFPGQSVQRVAPFRDTSLLFGVGDSLVLQTLDQDTLAWRRLCDYTLPSPAIDIFVFEALVYVTTQRHSVLILKVTNSNDFIFVESGSTTLSRMDLLHETTSLSMSNSISTCPTSVAVSQPQLSSNGPLILISVGSSLLCLTMEQNLEHVLNPKYQTSDSRLNASGSSLFCRVVFQAGLGINLHKMQVSHDIVYGSTLDGSLLQLTLLNQDQLQLLKLLQHLATTRDTAQTGFRGMPSFHARRRGNRSTANPEEDRYIDGDILMSLLDDGPENLKRLLSEQGSDSFDGYAEAVVGRQEDYAVAVMAWLEKMLETRLQARLG